MNSLLRLFLLTAICGFMLPTGVYASTLASQTDDSVLAATAHTTWRQQLGNAISASSFYVSITGVATSGTSPISLELDSCPTSAYTGCSIVFSNVTMGNLTTTASTISIGALATLNAGTYYKFVLNSSSGSFKVYGSSSSSSYPSGAVEPADGNIADMYFVATTYDTVPLQTQVVAVVTPTQLQTTASSNVPVTFTYLYNSSGGTYTKVGVQVFDHLTPQIALREGEQSIQTQAGLRTYSSTITLTDNHFYRMRPFIDNGIGTAAIYGPYIDFSTVSSQTFSQNYYATSSSLFSGVSTSTMAAVGAQCGDFSFNPVDDIGSALCRAGVFLFAPSPDALNSLADLRLSFYNKVPFSYIYAIYTAMGNWSLTDASSSPSIAIDITSMSCTGAWTGDVSNFTCDPHLKDWMPGTITLFSTSSLHSILPDSTVSYFKSIMEIAISVAMAFYFYDVIKRWRFTTT